MSRESEALISAESSSTPSAGDAEALRALLDVYRHLDAIAQLREVTRTLAEWSGAEAAFAIGPAESPSGQSGWAVVASGWAPDDPRLERVQMLPVVDAKRMTPATWRLETGLGSLAPIFTPTKVAEPAVSWLASVRGPADRCVAMVQLWLPTEPEPALVARMERFLDDARVAVGNAQQVATMQQLIIKDDTAHCFNRRYFEEFLPEELARASRFSAPLSLIFLDMDGLKAVNQKHGHSRGSRSLLEVSVRIRGRIRKFDKLFRFGGDEFCIVLPETECHGAEEVAERVREAISARPFLVQEVGGDGVPMTASLGIAAYPLHARNKQELILLADEAMQTIKNGTKNGVAVARVGERRGR